MEEPEPINTTPMASSTSSGPPELPRAPLETLEGFSDKLSPMLVKELRQGLRTHTFTIVFLSLQGLLTFVILIAGAASTGSGAQAAGGIVSKFVFCLYALTILVIQPLRGISTLSSEIKGNTIDLMVLTRLSAWRIVSGKWASIMGQTTLILVAILPYLMLRYFFGGMQLFSELFLIFYLFIASGTLTAFTIGISGLGSALIRGVVLVVGGMLLSIWVLFQFTPNLNTYINALSLTSSKTILLSLGLLILIAYIGYFFLELGTTFIAPAAENRSSRKRLIGLVVGLLSFAGAQMHDVKLAVGIASLIGLLLSFDLFSENQNFPSIVTRPFFRFKAFGRLIGRFLYPGWPTGTLFFLVYAGLITGLLYMNSTARGYDLRAWIITGIAFGAMSFPAAMIQIFARKSEHRHATYLAITIIGWLLAIILGFLFDTVPEESLLWGFSFIPMVQIPLLNELWDKASNRQHILLIVWSCAAVYWLIIFLFAFPHLRKIRKIEHEELGWEEES